MNHLDDDNTKNYISQEILQMKEQIAIAVILEDQLETLQNCILFRKNSMLHPALISPRNLREYIFHLKLAKPTTLPIEIQKDTSFWKLQKYYEICQIESEVIGTNIIFSITVPSVSYTHLTLPTIYSV